MSSAASAGTGITATGSGVVGSDAVGSDATGGCGGCMEMPVA